MPQPKTSAASKPAARKPAAKSTATKRDSAASASAKTSPAAKSTPAKSAASKPSSATSKSAAAAPKSATTKPSAAKKPTAKRSAAKPSAPSRTTTAKRATRATASGKPAAAKRSAQPASAPTTSDAARDEALKANLGALRELLAGGVVLTAQRVQESLDDAVERGRMTRRDAEDLARGLLDAGRRQSADILSDVEQLLGRSREELTSASSRVIEQAGDGGDRVLREVDRVRRGAGVGPTFPILNYAELKPGKITKRLGDLTPAQLRKVRDFERRNENRKTVLSAIERKLKK